ncbi:hypothetical protein DY000_02004505 [Brassica cretica]|uniref:Uncharacterized protein n=1 Tax=Brassica cretica TaxID=69181 RepID=A0ABQ7BW74_BRACR|nr:hypothetical protein DY000_02004505 [Brassica cretica]
MCSLTCVAVFSLCFSLPKLKDKARREVRDRTDVGSSAPSSFAAEVKMDEMCMVMCGAWLCGSDGKWEWCKYERKWGGVRKAEVMVGSNVTEAICVDVLFVVLVVMVWLNVAVGLGCGVRSVLVMVMDHVVVVGVLSNKRCRGCGVDVPMLCWGLVGAWGGWKSCGQDYMLVVCVCITRGLCVVGHYEVRKMSSSLWFMVGGCKTRSYSGCRSGWGMSREIGHVFRFREVSVVMKNVIKLVLVTRGLCVVGHHEVRKMSASLWVWLGLWLVDVKQEAIVVVGVGGGHAVVEQGVCLGSGCGVSCVSVFIMNDIFVVDGCKTRSSTVYLVDLTAGRPFKTSSCSESIWRGVVGREANGLVRGAGWCSGQPRWWSK